VPVTALMAVLDPSIGTTTGAADPERFAQLDFSGVI
jgi:hypothetical protein